ncbi:MAG: TIM barrel protein [Pseudomonadales bacterium]|nr:TIM barrel protein [Pseudomonadales bacterium]
MNRRQVLITGGAAALGTLVSPLARAVDLFTISLAQFSLHRTYYGDHAKKGWAHLGKLLRENPAAAVSTGPDPSDFPILSKTQFGIDAVEYVNQFYYAQLGNDPYFKEIALKADDYGVVSHLMMLDGTGPIGAADKVVRSDARENVKRWMAMANLLGCSIVRVNAQGDGDPVARAARTADALDQLAEDGQSMGLAVVVENHGGLSSDGAWLANVMSMAKHSGVGTLPDFGNFKTGQDAQGEDVWYDRYLGVTELMPYAKAVSAKSYGFGSDGNDTATDYNRMMKIVLDAGYRGYVGIEYEGRELDEASGIRATKALLERIRDQYRD